MNTETITGMYQELGVDKDVLDFGNAVEKTLKKRFAQIDEVTEYNQLKVIGAMQKMPGQRRIVSQGSTGYGYNDLGRETLERCLCCCFPHRSSTGASTDYLWNPCTGTGTGWQFASR